MFFAPLDDRVGATLDVIGDGEVTKDIGTFKFLGSAFDDGGDCLEVIVASGEDFLAFGGAFEIEDEAIDDAVHIVESIAIEVSVCVEEDGGAMLPILFDFEGSFEDEGELRGGFAADPFDGFGPLCTAKVLA